MLQEGDDGVVLQRLVDCLLHLLSISADPKARLFAHANDDDLSRRMGASSEWV